jgi:hypothetical protein
MQSKKLVGNKLSASTQKYLDIAEIRDDCIVLKDGTLRAVLLASSVNFALKSTEEQEAIIQGYVNFLNSLNFPFQIVIQSRKLDIDNYIARLKEKAAQQTNELLRMQTREYITYVQELVEMGEIMSKRFFVVIPYNPLSDKAKGFFVRFGELFRAAKVVRLGRKRFEKLRTELFKRVNYVANNLLSMGINTTSLDTQSLIELFYQTYNPTESKQEKMVEVEKLRIES